MAFYALTYKKDNNGNYLAYLETTVDNADLVGLSMVGVLDVGELLAGTLTVGEVGTSDLVLTNKAINTAELTINEKKVPIGRAVLFLLDPSSATIGTTYTILITSQTDSTPPQTKTMNVMVKVTAAS